MLAAISKHDLALTTKLLEKNADPELYNPRKGERPIQMAIRKDMSDILEILVEKVASLSCRDSRGRGVLSYAITWNSIDAIPYLCEQAIDLDDQDYDGQTPLILSITGGIRGFDIVGELLRRKVNIDHQDRWGKTALMYAVTADSTTSSKLIDANADHFLTDIRGRNALYWAALNSSQSSFERLLVEAMREAASPSHFSIALHAAAAACRVDFAETLLNEYPVLLRQSDDDDCTAALTASRYHCSAISALIDETSKRRTFRKKIPPEGKSPTAWHEKDLSRGMLLQADGRTITIDRKSQTRASLPDAPSLSSSHFHISNQTRCSTVPGIHKKAIFGTVRADHAMIPQAKGKKDEQAVYYFEVKFEKEGKKPDEQADRPP